MTRAVGPDVSHFRPVTSFAELEASPRRPTLVGVKATEGLGFVDPTLRAHRDGFRASGLLFAAYYHFARSGSAKDQARRLMDAVGPLEPRERLALDLEVAPAADAVTTLAWLDDFFDALLGGACSDCRPLLYTSGRIWRQICGDLPWFLGTSEVDLWVKRYSESMMEPEVPRPWVDVGWTFWQWSDGEVPPSSFEGIGPCDTNYFRGDEAELAEYAGTGGREKGREERKGQTT